MHLDSRSTVLELSPATDSTLGKKNAISLSSDNADLWFLVLTSSFLKGARRKEQLSLRTPQTGVHTLQTCEEREKWSSHFFVLSLSAATVLAPVQIKAGNWLQRANICWYSTAEGDGMYGTAAGKNPERPLLLDWNGSEGPLETTRHD
ncbi:hypothetical protein E1301_Tti003949 [Triplophysa tibetana]|uniref:Uncharacterized protein n=1 Tax=Triplophysa tibetana TaxID=1572043 RepID=A0A5A9NL89_9TELE|nr:hypothetical protein E1301_Tti003949 [Triplophysa tibetana]